jgi:hypothetical protein
MLLERGADPNDEESDEELRPPGGAADIERLSIAKLLKYDADPNLPRTSKKSSYSLEIDRSRSSLVITISRNHIAVMELLLASGADPAWESINVDWLDTYSSDQRQEHRWQVSDR